VAVAHRDGVFDLGLGEQHALVHQGRNNVAITRAHAAPRR
jgi:hypothetical protein